LESTITGPRIVRARMAALAAMFSPRPIVNSQPRTVTFSQPHDALAYTCARGAAICANLNTNICFTNDHFGQNSRNRAITAIHEAAHLQGLSTGSPQTNPDIYEHQNRFLDMAPAQTVQNADSYALAAAVLGTQDQPSTRLFTASAGGGYALSPHADRTWYFHGMAGAEVQHPALRIFHPTLNVGFTLIGEAENPDTRVRAPTSALVSLLPGVRLGESRRPGAGGGFQVSLFGGPALSLGGTEPRWGAVAGAAFGYRWRMIEISAGGGYVYDPLRSPAGLAHTATVGGTVTLNLLP
jgi:hypothetical protein